jgi:IS30 family transposase
MLDNACSFKAIAKALGRDCNTISREVLRNSTPKQNGAFGAAFNNCKLRYSCVRFGLCSKEDCTREYCRRCNLCPAVCPDYDREDCEKLELPPYVCNGCGKRSKCTLEKFIYIPTHAHVAYEQTLRVSRDGIALSEAELARLDKLISPLITKGQSPHVICKNHKDEIMLDEKTIYTYIKSGLFTSKSTDLLRVLKMKPRRKKKPLKVERACFIGRNYRDFLAYMNEHPDTPVVEMDSLIGKKGDGEKVVLTMHFRESQLMLAFLRDANTASSVKEIFDDLYKILGVDKFKQMFPVILTDRGSEFSNPSALEFVKQVRRTRVFFCDAGSPYQKGACENNHTLVRRIHPKGKSFNQLSQKDINLMMNHVNSYTRKKLNESTPIATFSLFHKPLILLKLGICIINPDDVILKPEMLKK